MMKNLPDNSIDLVLTDPPYAACYRPLYSDLGREARRALKPGGFLVSYMNQNGLPEILGRLEEHLDYYWLGMALYSGMSPPGYWRKHAKIVSYGKPLAFFQKPPRTQPAQWTHDFVCGGRIEREYHRWQQPLGESKALIEQLTRPGDLVVDPFMGSGTVLVAARELGRRAIGYEKEERTYQTALQRLGIRPRNPFLPAADLLPARGIILPTGRISQKI